MLVATVASKVTLAIDSSSFRAPTANMLDTPTAKWRAHSCIQEEKERGGRRKVGGKKGWGEERGCGERGKEGGVRGRSEGRREE